MIADRHALPTRLKHFLTLPIALLAIVLAAQPAASQNHLWSQQLGGTGGESGNAVAVDSKGNVVVTGYFTDSVDFGGGNLTSAGILDVFLAKYDAYGVHQWSKRFGATQTDNGLAVVVDANLNVLFAGSFKGTVDFGGGSLIAAGSEDIFLAKFNAAGVHQWSLGFGDTDPDQCSGIAVDDAGNVYITGHFNGTVDFGGGSLVSEGLKEIFLAKYDANGTHVWSQSFGNEFDDVGRAVEIDPAGNVIVTGSFTARVDFGGGNLSGVGETPDIFLVKFDGDGVHQWSQSFGDSGNDQGYALAIDAFSNVYVTGGFWGTVDFGDGDRVSVGFEDIFLARYDPAGGHMLSMRYGGTDFDFGTGIDVDADGNMYLSARFAGNVDFGGGLLTSAGGNDIVLTKYGPGASVFWSQRFGGTGQDGPGAITVDRIGNVVMTGLFSDNVDFGGGTFVGQGNTDAFLAKYGTPLVLPEISSILDIGNDQGGSVRITFDATNKDYPGSSDPVLNYGAYRRIDPVASLTSRVTLEESDPGPYLEGWEFVGSIPANGEPVYNMIVSTLADSSVVSGIHWTGFFVRALTADPYTYFDSPPDSGYSVDNLAPSSPLNLAFVVPGLLAWDHVPDADFDYYTVYGSYSSNFGTSAVEVEFTTGNTSLVGWTPYPYFYVTATDFSGNESDAASPSPPTGIGDKPVALTPALSSHPNPFNPVTTIAFTVTSPGLVTLAVYDVDGELVETLIDREYRITNTYQIQFRPTSASGIYFARLETADWIRSIKLVLLK